MKTIAVVQARTGSSRLPGKVLMPLDGKPVIAWVIDRAAQCGEIDKVILATTADPEDDALARWAEDSGVPCFRGDENDVLGRYYHAGVFSSMEQNDILVRITGDCPLIDSDVCSAVIRLLKDEQADYASNVNPPTFPDGLDCEAIRFSAIERSYKEARLSYEREHVTQYILRRPELFKMVNLTNEKNLSHMRWTLDEIEDYRFLCVVTEKMGNNNFKMVDTIELLQKNPEIARINANYERNEGLMKSIREATSH